MPRIDQLLKIVKLAKASDLHLVAGSVPMIRLNPRLEKSRHQRRGSDGMKSLIRPVDSGVADAEQTERVAVHPGNFYDDVQQDQSELLGA